VVRVRPVRSRRDRRAFIELPYRLYRHEPLWVPPLRRDVAEMLDPRRHPFHLHSEVELFVAESRGRVAGRIAAIHNRRHVEFHGERAGFFGFLEMEREPEVAAALVEAAAAWVRGRGLEILRGPASFSTNEEAGLLVEGFDTPPVLMMPWNPPWYADLLEGVGFRKARTCSRTGGATPRSPSGSRALRTRWRGGTAYASVRWTAGATGTRWRRSGGSTTRPGSGTGGSFR
jgi:hypothetical protein